MMIPSQATKLAGSRAHAIINRLFAQGCSHGQVVQTLTYALCLAISTTKFQGGKAEVVSAIVAALEIAAADSQAPGDERDPA